MLGNCRVLVKIHRKPVTGSFRLCSPPPSESSLDKALACGRFLRLAAGGRAMQFFASVFAFFAVFVFGGGRAYAVVSFV